MKVLCGRLLAVAAIALLLGGCGGVRNNIAYFPAEGSGTKIASSVKGAVLPVLDLRETTKIYPKQIISHTSYYDDKTYDINDRPIDQVFEEALSTELYGLGVSLVRTEGIDGPLDKQTFERVRKELMVKYPEAKVAFGLKVLDFMGTSKRNLLTTDAKFTSSIELGVLDVETGDLVWSDFKTERTDTVMSADRHYMVEQLNGVLTDVMKKAVRDNLSLRDVLVKVSSR